MGPMRLVPRPQIVRVTGHRVKDELAQEWSSPSGLCDISLSFWQLQRLLSARVCLSVCLSAGAVVTSGLGRECAVILLAVPTACRKRRGGRRRERGERPDAGSCPQQASGTEAASAAADTVLGVVSLGTETS